jgi:hypothetical protein
MIANWFKMAREVHPSTARGLDRFGLHKFFGLIFEEENYTNAQTERFFVD